MDALLHVIVVEDNHDDAERVIAALRRDCGPMEVIRTNDELSFAKALQGRCDVILADHRPTAFSAMQALAVLRVRDDPPPLIIVSDVIGTNRPWRPRFVARLIIC